MKKTIPYIKHVALLTMGEGKALRLALALIMTLLLAACSAIDEDLTDCGKDYTIHYTVRLHTNMQTTLNNELTTPQEKELQTLLEQQLANVFTDRAADIDLSFFNTGDNPATLASHSNHVMNGAQQSYTLYLPVDGYRHVAMANTTAEPQVDITGSESLSTIGLHQKATTTDTLTSHSAALYTARLDMDVEDKTQEFNVDLYMANATVVFVLDHSLVQVDSIWGCVTDMATAFNVSDSTYTFTPGTATRCNTVSTTSGLTALYATGFPTEGSFHIKAYVRYTSGKIDELDLECSEALKAGELRIVKGKLMNEDGDFEMLSKDVAVNIKLDWKPGGHHDIEI